MVNNLEKFKKDQIGLVFRVRRDEKLADHVLFVPSNMSCNTIWDQKHNSLLLFDERWKHILFKYISYEKFRDWTWVLVY